MDTEIFIHIAHTGAVNFPEENVAGKKERLHLSYIVDAREKGNQFFDAGMEKV